MSQIITKKLLIQNLKGLHARATASFVKVASQFQSDIEIAKSEDGMTVSGKSIMGILMLAVPLGTEITVTAKGSDAQEAVNALEELVNARFNED